MENTKLRALLKQLRACEEARKFVAGQSLAEAWVKCNRADWMLWLCGKMADEDGWPTRQQVVLAACACAETALKFVKKGETRPAAAIKTARKWARGEATLQEVRAAAADAAADAAAYAAAAYAATAAAAYAYAAAAADAAAAYAATAAAYVAAAADAAAAAAAAAAADAAAAAYAADSYDDAAAQAKALAEMADIVRNMLVVP